MELIAVVAVVAVIFSLLLPALSTSKVKAGSVYCRANLRQLYLAWQGFADDNNGNLPGVLGGSFPGPGRWVSGWLDFSSSPDNTNTLYLTDVNFSQLAPYLNTAKVYRCPADTSRVTINGRDHPRSRSVSMNCWMNYIGSAAIGQDEYVIFRNLSDIHQLSADRAWVFMDERDDSINDGLFQTNLKRRGVQARIVDYPSAGHGRSAGLVFADGHSEIKRWMDRRTIPPARARQLLDLDVSSPDNHDVKWLQEHSSVARSLAP